MSKHSTHKGSNLHRTDAPGALDTNPFLSLAPMQTDTLELEPGTELDRFHIVRVLGRGCLGQVYLAHDQFSEQDVALKIVRLGLEQADDIAAVLRYEKRMYDKVKDHRHVLKVNDLHCVRYGGAKLLLLSLEYAEGGSLRQWLTERIADWPTRRTEGLQCFRHLCQGMATLHEVGLSHLDPKPENFLFKDGALKVSDLATSVFLEQQSLSSAPSCRDLGLETSVGTPCYMSPEHFTSLRSDLDCRCDIYSLGIILYEILSPKGRPPFQGDYERLRDLHTSVTPPPLDGASDERVRVVYRCLEKDPAKRYQAVKELLEDLEDSSTDTVEHGPDNRRRMDYLWNRACECLEENRPEDSRRFCRQLLELCPDDEEAIEMLAQLDARFEQAGDIYHTIELGMSCRSLDELVELVTTAVEIYPNHPKGAVAQIQLEARSEQYLLSMEEGLTALRQGSWEHAKAMFEKAKTYNHDAIEVDKAIRFAAAVIEKQQEIRQVIDQALAVRAFDRAIELANTLDEYLKERQNEVNSLFPEIL